MEVKSVGTNVRMSHPTFEHANASAVKTSLFFQKLRLFDDVADTFSKVSENVIITPKESKIENMVIWNIKGGAYNKDIGMAEDAPKNNYKVYAKKIIDSLLKADESANAPTRPINTAEINSVITPAA